MTDIAKALTELGIKEWVLRGEPTNKDEFSTMYAKITGADANGSAIESTKESEWGTTWEAVVAKRDALIAEEPMRLLRAERNQKLAETDWMGNSDVTMSTAWKNYRKALRDLPASADPKIKDGMLDQSSVTWPTKPS
tara:strand:- start:280 stop:690 length:411 start_codon:yes stop_codon:yes gene_type:complete